MEAAGAMLAIQNPKTTVTAAQITASPTSNADARLTRRGSRVSSYPTGMGGHAERWRDMWRSCPKYVEIERGAPSNGRGLASCFGGPGRRLVAGGETCLTERRGGARTYGYVTLGS